MLPNFRLFVFAFALALLALAATGRGLVMPPDAYTRVGNLPEMGRPLVQQAMVEHSESREFRRLAAARRASEVDRLVDLPVIPVRADAEESAEEVAVSQPPPVRAEPEVPPDAIAALSIAPAVEAATPAAPTVVPPEVAPPPVAADPGAEPELQSAAEARPALKLDATANTATVLPSAAPQVSRKRTGTAGPAMPRPKPAALLSLAAPDSPPAAVDKPSEPSTKKVRAVEKPRPPRAASRPVRRTAKSTANAAPQNTANAPANPFGTIFDSGQDSAVAR